jgi:hypothetical protein
VDHDEGEVARSLALATSGTDHTGNFASIVRAPWGERSVTEFLLSNFGIC